MVAGITGQIPRLRALAGLVLDLGYAIDLSQQPRSTPSPSSACSSNSPSSSSLSSLPGAFSSLSSSSSKKRKDNWGSSTARFNKVSMPPGLGGASVMTQRELNLLTSGVAGSASVQPRAGTSSSLTLNLGAAGKIYGPNLVQPRPAHGEAKPFYVSDWRKGLLGKTPEGIWVTQHTAGLQRDLPEHWQHIKDRRVGSDGKHHFQLYCSVVVLLVVDPGLIQRIPKGDPQRDSYLCSMHCTNGRQFADNATVNYSWFEHDRSKLEGVRAGTILVVGLRTRDLTRQPYIAIWQDANGNDEGRI